MSPGDRDQAGRGSEGREDTPQPLGTFAPFGEFDEISSACHALGIDSGATLLKLCARDEGGGLHFGTWSAPASERVGALVRRLDPERIGVSGCGAAEIGRSIGRPEATRGEFDTWARGAGEMLDLAGLAPEAPYLLVSLGTGTTMLRIDGDEVDRVGGTALGGGTLLGLGFALTGARSHHEVVALAAEGERARVDLLIGDLFEDGSEPLMAQATASSFGKLGRAAESAGSDSPDPDTTLAPRDEDLAAGVLGLVAENIGLMANARAAAAGVSRIVYGGSTLNDNPHLGNFLRGIGLVAGFEAIVLPHGGHAGALGAMLLGSRVDD